MHTTCFVRMLEAQKGAPKCAVCGALYEDVGWKVKRVPQLLSPCGLVTLLTCSAIALLGCGINTAFVLQHLHNSTKAVIWMVVLLMNGGFIGALACVAEILRQHGWRAVWASRVREERVFVVGAVRLPARTTLAELALGELATTDAPVVERHTR